MARPQPLPPLISSCSALAIPKICRPGDGILLLRASARCGLPGSAPWAAGQAQGSSGSRNSGGTYISGNSGAGYLDPAERDEVTEVGGVGADQTPREAYG
jgi:hypothetical protein